MNTPRSSSRRLPLVLSASLSLILPCAVRAQGPLNPTAGPAPSMKSLSEVEARTIVNAANTPGVPGSFAYRISQPGSYYLTGNITVDAGYGIDIVADNVTLDLNGFTISSTAESASGYGVALDGTRTNVTVLNGSISGTTTNSGSSYTGGGFATGVGSTSGSTVNARVAGISVSGVGGNGINLPGGVVQGSSVNVAAGQGIVATTVANSVANATGSTAINATSISNVAGTTTGSGAAIISAPDAALQTSLTALQPRTPIPGGSSTYTITQPGSYYLTGNLTVASGDAIVIQADNVTLDLNGFTLSSTSLVASGHGVMLTGARSLISISNGLVRSGCTVTGTTISGGPGFISGIDYSIPPQNVRVSGVSVTGVKSWGIDLGNDPASTVQDCVVRISGNIGIHAGSVSDSSATQCLGNSINAVTISNSVGSLLTGGTGVTLSGPPLATETRIPISSAPYTINAPGSYYLTGNLTVSGTDNGITVGASNVTLDLNGFSITSTAGAPSNNNGGVVVNSTIQNLQVRNGSISGTAALSGTTFSSGGFRYGIASISGSNVLIENVTVSQVAFIGIQAPTGTVRNCRAQLCAGTGIDAQVVQGCTATSCGTTGISGEVVSDCSGESLGSSAGYGVVATSSVSNSHGIGNGQSIGLRSYYTVADCNASAQNAPGILGTTVTNSRGTSASADGIQANLVTNSYGQTSGTTESARGINALNTATCCYGQIFGGGSSISLKANIAIGCSTNNGTPVANYKYNMP